MNVCVYCGASPGRYSQVAVDMGQEMGERGWGLVYGGGNCGMMGTIAATVLLYEEPVTGIITEDLLATEIKGEPLGDIIVVKTMHQRKAKMVEMSDMLVALPGGIGTLDELCEALSWAQLKIHNKPVGLLNPDGYWDHFIGMLDTAVAKGYIKQHHRDLLIVSDSPKELLDRMVPLVPPKA